EVPGPVLRRRLVRRAGAGPAPVGPRPGAGPGCCAAAGSLPGAPGRDRAGGVTPAAGASTGACPGAPGQVRAGGGAPVGQNPAGLPGAIGRDRPAATPAAGGPAGAD